MSRIVYLSSLLVIFVEEYYNLYNVTEDREVTLRCTIAEGKYDLYASLVDSQGVVHPSYYLYIEKL